MLQRRASKLLKMYEFAESLADLSTCKRLTVGCVIAPVSCSRVHAIGYNGPARGEGNDSCRDEVAACGCIHAEANAIAKFNPDTASDRHPTILHVTAGCCMLCAGLIVNTGVIQGVVYGSDYRDGLGLLRLKENAVHILRSGELLSLRHQHTNRVVEDWLDAVHERFMI